MRRISWMALGLSLVALAGCARPLSQDQTGATRMSAKAVEVSQRSQLRIYFRDPAQLAMMQRNGVDLFENVNRDEGWVDALATPTAQHWLDKAGIRYVVTMDAKRLKAFGIPSGYQSVQSLMQDMTTLAAAHPTIMRTSTIGSSLEKRPIMGVQISSHPDTGLPSLLITSGQHARELPPVEVTSRFIHMLVENYGKDAAITKLVDTRDIWIVPVVNPDGRTAVEKGDSMWRKNRRDNGDGTRGVDTNRNEDDHFSQGDDDSSADDYRGSAPFSEPESQAIRDLCVSKKFVLSLDLHCYAGMVLWPPGYDNSYTKDEPTFSAIGQHLAKHIGYRAGTIARTIYNTYGDMATWEYNKLGILAFAAELNDPGFGPSYSQVDKDWNQWKDNLTYLVDVAGNPKAASGNNAFMSFGL